jgi:hypothetical protein
MIRMAVARSQSWGSALLAVFGAAALVGGSVLGGFGAVLAFCGVAALLRAWGLERRRWRRENPP